MADTFKPSRILSHRGREIFLELSAADQRSELLRCIAEAIAYVEERFNDPLAPEHQLLYSPFKFYEDKKE